jgi:hypothetical protein
MLGWDRGAEARGLLKKSLVCRQLVLGEVMDKGFELYTTDFISRPISSTSITCERYAVI